MIQAISILLTALFILIGRGKTSPVCALSKYCTAAGWCENFTSLFELNSLIPPLTDAAVCQNIFNDTIIYNRTKSSPPDTATVYLKANAYKSLVNDQLDMNRFLSSILPTQDVNDVLVYLCGFTGIDLNITFGSQLAPLFATNNWTEAQYFLSIGYISSAVDLYMNGAAIVMSSDRGRSCDETQLAKIFNKTKMNFSVFSWAEGLYIRNVKQPHGPLCALVFKNTNLMFLNVHGIPLKFVSTQSEYDLSGTNIFDLELQYIAIEQLDATIIHPQVFSSLTKLTFISCSIRRIQPDLFINMNSLQLITLGLYNLKSFVHGNGIGWMSCLGSSNSTLTPDSFKGQAGSTCDNACQNLLNSLVLIAFNEIGNSDLEHYPVAYFPNFRYTFPDADFCTFANFSFNKLLVVTWTVITQKHDPLLNSNCSCTMLWLLKNLALVLNFPDDHNVMTVLDFTLDTICNINDLTTFSETFTACNFSNRLQNCAPIIGNLNETETNYSDQYFLFYNIQYFLKQANNFLSNGFSIGVSVFALVTNLTTLIVILNARRHHTAQGPVFKKDDELNSIGEAFFSYMVANAVINSIFSLTILLNTCINCVPKPVDEQFVNVTGCVIRNMCVAGVLSLMKLMSNFTYLQISMNRYLLVGKDHAKWVETVAKSNFKTNMCISFIISFLLSLVSVYQDFYFEGFYAKDNKGEEYNSYYYYHSYLFGRSLHSYYSDADLDMADLDSAVSMLPLIFTLTLLHDVFSYFLFCFLSLAFDVMTVLKLKESLAEKARLSSTNKRDEQMQAERRSVIMVVLNSIVNILLRLPELLAIVFFFAVAVNSNQKYPFKVVCYDFGQCLTLGQISNSFVILSLSLNIFFYYFFNKTFKFAFHLFFCDGQKSKALKKLYK
jgi:hypothetical protein